MTRPTITSQPDAALHTSSRQLEGKVAVVTAAGRGIGRGIARVFAREGAKVVAASLGVDE